jgi:hypothetical protein
MSYREVVSKIVWFRSAGSVALFVLSTTDTATVVDEFVGGALRGVLFCCR